MITIEQCRGARGLLGWTQQDLADASGLSKTAINNFEKGHSDIKTESLKSIRMAFESADIEFIGLDGVSKRKDTTRILRGASALNDLIEDIHETLSGSKTDILISHVDQSLASRIATQKLFEHIEFLKTNNIQERILCTQADKHILSPMDSCRLIHSDNIALGTTTFIYGGKIAIEFWNKEMIMVITSAEAAKAERDRFELLWSTAQSIEGADSNQQNNAKGRA